MAAVLAQSDGELSDCSLLSLLPRTLRSSYPAGAEMSESKELDSISKFFKSTALKGSTELLEQAQMVRNINHLSIPNGQNDDVETISNKRTGEDQMELQGRRDRQRRPGLLGSDRMKQAFNFSAKTIAFESSQMGANSLLKRPKISESNSEGDKESWPVIDYSCLEHIADPVEYFSTYQKLENAEKEVQRLKGDSYLTLSKPHGRRDRQRRPGILERNGKKSVFKFPGMVSAQVDTSSLSNGSNYTELTNSSYSKGINQIGSSEIVALESKFVGNAEIHDSKGDVDTNEHEKLVHTCKELDERGIANLVQEALHIKPINVEKLRTPAVSTAVQYNLGSFQICKDAPAMASTSILKKSFSLINSQDDPFSPICINQNGDGCKQTGDSYKIKSNCRDIYDDDIEESQGGERGNQIGDSGKLRPNGKDSDVTAKLGMETLKTKLPDAKKTAWRAGHSSILQNPHLLMDVNGRLAEISKLKRRLLLENSPGSQHYVFNDDDFGDLSASKSWEKHSLSPKITCCNGSYQSDQNASIPDFLNGRKLGFEDKMQSPIEETTGTELGFEDKMQSPIEETTGTELGFEDKMQSPVEETTGTEFGFEDKMQSPIEETTGTDKYISSMNTSEYPKRCLNSLLEVSAAFPWTDSALNKTEFLSSVSEVNLEEVGQVSTSVNCKPSKCLVNTHEHFGNPGTSADACFHQLGNPSPAEVNIAVQEERLDLEAAKDDGLPNEMAPLDKDLETSINLNVNQEHLRASRVIENKKTRGKAPPGQQNKGHLQNQEHLRASRIIENKKTRGKAPPRQKNKGSSHLRRKSLAGAGTKWESGVRRSTRIKMTPLQHWCGERFLYGRVHDSLPTVIGVKKYGTPLQDGTRAMKVKSYVSSEFADLVALAALH